LTSSPEIVALAEPGREQVLSVEDWAEIRRLRRAEGMPIAEIARVMGISRNTVQAALASDNPPKYARLPQGSVADAFEPRIRELLAAFPPMPATVIAERVGWPYPARTLSAGRWRSGGRRTCRRIRRRGRPMRPGRSPAPATPACPASPPSPKAWSKTSTPSPRA
jgi:Sigma-70, region 4